MKFPIGLLPLCIAAALVLPVQASSPTGPTNIPQRSEIPVQQHALAFFLQRFQADLASTEHVYDINAGTAARSGPCAVFIKAGWPAWASSITRSSRWKTKSTYALFKRELNYRISQLEFERTRSDQALELLPGIAPLIELAEQRRALKPLLPEQAKHLLTQATDALLRSRKALETQKPASHRLLPCAPPNCCRHCAGLQGLEHVLQRV